MLRLVPVGALGRFALCCAALLAVAAGVTRAAPESPRFTRLSVTDGLSQSSVQQILQDRRGFLWFGTQEGLNRYDGYRFTVHRARNQEGFLGDHDITALIQDARGDLWVGTARGLYRHDLETGRFDRCAPPVDGLDITELVLSRDGRIFFAGSDGRLWVLDPASTDRQARPLHEGEFGALSGITALTPAAASGIWAVAGSRLFEVNPSAAPGARVAQALEDVGAVTVMATAPNGDIWMGGRDAGLLRYRPADRRIDPFPQTPRDALAILPGKAGEIWIGARAGGLTRLDPATGDLVVYRHDPEDASSLWSDDVAAIYEGANGSLWVGTWNGGVNQFDPHAQAFRTFRHRARVPDSLPADDVTVMTETPDGRLWFASRSGIVGAGDPATGRFRTVTSMQGRGRVMSLASWHDRLLLGTSDGLVAIDATTGRIVALEAPLRAHGLDRRPIAAIRTAAGVAWIAGGRELFRLTRGDGVVRAEPFAVPMAGLISTISLGGDGRVWVGSDRGEVVRAEAGAAGSVVMRPLDIAEGAREAFAARGVLSTLHEHQRGQLWVGTRRGLGRVELASGQVSWLGQRAGLPSTVISGIAGDADGRLWIGHNRGLTRLEPSTGAMTHFGERDGAQGNGYAESAWTVGASGHIYFAGDGITAFDPREVKVTPYKPAVAFTALEVLHRPVAPRWLDPSSPLERTIDAENEITLGPHANVFSVEMAPLHYADPPSNRLMYRLEGFDPDWIETGASNRLATYTNLGPGRYVLRARAGTKNGLWSEQEATLAIQILPPWWRTNAALAAGFALAFAAVGLGWMAARRRARVKLALLERETLRRESLTDPLTGLYNRRFLIAWLQQEVPRVFRDYRIHGARATAAGADLLLLLIDIDHFKAINDHHSHAVGDRWLSRIADVIKEHVRGSDLAVRWGGDEFLVVTRSFQRARGAESAERLRAAVEAVGTRLAAEGEPACTVSIGFAAFPFLPQEPEALSWEQTLELADHALRLTKRRRRNSYTGVQAAPGLTAAAVREFLAGSGAAPPAGLDVLAPRDEQPGQ